jgi:predicted NAD/FAD-binding protein
MPFRKRIAVVGSGISGLSAAWLLAKDHEVVLYEAAGRLGGHSNTVTVPVDGRDIPVDTGFIVYNEATYPNLTAFLDHLKVETVRSNMSFGVSLDGGGFEYASSRLSSYFRDPRTILNPRFWQVVREVVRFYRTAPADMRRMAADGMSLGAFLDACGYGQAFQEDHLLPQAAAIWSCSMQEIRTYPAASFLAFCDTHGLMRFSGRPKWRTVVGGSRSYVAAVAADFAGEIRLNAPVASVRRMGGGVEVRDGSGAVDRFDDIVLACHADQALRMLADPGADERASLSSFRYSHNTVSLHSDPRMMPSRRHWWSSWNYLGHTGDHSEATVTYWMNLLQDLPTKTDLFVTLNPPSRLKLAGEVQRIDYEHPLFDGAAMAAQKGLWSLQGTRNTWFCGAYFGAGFHEDGLQAGLAVAEQLGGGRRPWTVADESGRIVVTQPWGAREAA